MLSGGFLCQDVSTAGKTADLRYDTRWIGLPASAIGAPRLRLRIFILARRTKSAVGTGPTWTAARRALLLRHAIRARREPFDIDHAVNKIDCMVNSFSRYRERNLSVVIGLVMLYVVSVVATIIALVLLSALAPKQATNEAWGHAIIVAVFAVVLPLRLCAARRGNRRARIAVGVIATVLVVVNVVEAAIPGFVPVWMRIAMLGTAVLMAVIALLALRRHP